MSPLDVAEIKALIFIINEQWGRLKFQAMGNLDGLGPLTSAEDVDNQIKRPVMLTVRKLQDVEERLQKLAEKGTQK